MKTSHHLLISCLVIGIASGCRSPRKETARPRASISATSSSAGTAQSTASGGTPSIPPPLVSLNKLFLEGYRERQVFVKTNTSPVIVGDFNSLILYWNGVAETNPCIPDIYQALKAVAHVPFGIYLRVDGHAGDPEGILPESVLGELRAYPAGIAAAEASLDEAGFSPAQTVRQKAILKQSGVYLAKVLARRAASRKELMTFSREVGPLLLKNADEAAAAELDMTHAVVMQWKRRIPPEEWRRLVVVIRGPQMPRRLNLLTQYFAKVIHEPSHDLGYPLESRHLIYAESIFGNRDHLDLMATTFVDGDASEAFFGDRWRMSRDILADGAAEYLKRLKFD